MITPEQDAKINEFLQSSGYKAPNSGGDWHNQIKTFQGTPTVGENVAQQWQEAGQKMVSSVTGGAEKIAAGQEEGGLKGTAKSVLGAGEAGLGAASGAVQAIFAPFTGIMQNVADKTGIHPMSAIAGTEAGKKLSAFAEAHPELSTNIQDAINVGLAIAGSKGLDTEIPNFKETMGNIGEDIKTGIGTIKTGVSNLKEKITSPLKGKAEAEILATPESELHKLSASERKVYFDAKQAEITSQAKLAEENVNKDLEAKMTASQTEAEGLQKELQTSTRDEVINLRPKIREALGRQSAEYRRLVDEELAGKGDIKVNADDVRSFVETRYVQSPEQAQAILRTLDVPESGETTIKNIYNQIKSLKQDIGASVKKGVRVFTPEEKLVDDSISTLVDFMKKNGVDLKKANKFWAEYAPIRNQLVSESKPFLQTGTQTKTFANTLLRVAKGADVNNENFIGEVENLLDEPIAKDTKSILSKLDMNEKQALANGLGAEAQKAEIALTKESALKSLSSKEIEVARNAAYRSVVKKILYTAGGLGIDKIIKKYTGFGI